MSKRENKLLRRRMVNAYLSSVISISLVLLLVGAAALLAVNVGGVSRYLKENMKISVIFNQEVTGEQAEKYAGLASLLPYVKDVRVVSREEGEKELAKMLGEDFLSVFETSPVPVSADVSLKAEYVVADSLALVVKALSASPLVDEVDSRQGLVEALDTNLTKISAVFAVLIAVLLFISFALINNMVRLSVYARRFTIHTMKLVGATRSFITAPFLKAALVQGLVASVISTAALSGILYALNRSFPEFFSVLSRSSLLISAGIIFATGALLCTLSTYFVVGKLSEAPKDDLYY